MVSISSVIDVVFNTYYYIYLLALVVVIAKMAMVSENELLMIALILNEEEEKVEKNGYESIQHGIIDQEKGNFPFYIRN